MKYAIVKFDYETFYTHAFFDVNEKGLENENVVAYAATKKQATQLVNELGFYIAK